MEPVTVVVPLAVVWPGGPAGRGGGLSGGGTGGAAGRHGDGKRRYHEAIVTVYTYNNNRAWGVTGERRIGEYMPPPSRSEIFFHSSCVRRRWRRRWRKRRKRRSERREWERANRSAAVDTDTRQSPVPMTHAVSCEHSCISDGGVILRPSPRNPPECGADGGKRWMGKYGRAGATISRHGKTPRSRAPLFVSSTIPVVPPHSRTVTRKRFWKRNGRGSWVTRDFLPRNGSRLENNRTTAVRPRRKLAVLIPWTEGISPGNCCKCAWVCSRMTHRGGGCETLSDV